MKAEVERKEIIKRALAMLHDGQTLDRDEVRLSEPDNEIEHMPETATAETFAVSVLAENGPDEVDAILRVWSDLFGKRLHHESVRKQLAALREWQRLWRSR